MKTFSDISKQLTNGVLPDKEDMALLVANWACGIQSFEPTNINWFMKLITSPDTHKIDLHVLKAMLLHSMTDGIQWERFRLMFDDEAFEEFCREREELKHR